MKKEHKKNIQATKFFVEQNELGLSKTKVADLFDANRKAISKLENSYNKYVDSARYIDKDYMFYFEKHELNACKEFVKNSHSTKSEIIKKYNIGSVHTLDNWLEILGFSIDRHYKYNFNRKTFAQSPSEELAYWIGFLLADGCVDKYTLEVGLAEKDKEHLYKLARFLGYSKEEINNSIYSKTGGAYTKDNLCYYLCINSVEIVKDLQKYNIINKKSLKEQPFHFKEPEFQLAFIRGYIDGDGFVSSPLAKGNHVLGIVGSKEVCEYIRKILKQYTNAWVPEVKEKQKSKNGQNSLYYWQTTNKQATVDLLKALYPKNCSIYLTRKYNNAQKICHV